MKKSILLFITLLVFVFAANLIINIYAGTGHKSHDKKKEEKDTTHS
ncbi:hypothetical protein HY745_05240 [Candidatus Desantisbacteria bacterium]|nr:hypothetical protein [Candidatus Desantisbacteria bacterium]